MRSEAIRIESETLGAAAGAQCSVASRSCVLLTLHRRRYEVGPPSGDHLPDRAGGTPRDRDRGPDVWEVMRTFRTSGTSRLRGTSLIWRISSGTCSGEQSFRMRRVLIRRARGCIATQPVASPLADGGPLRAAHAAWLRRSPRGQRVRQRFVGRGRQMRRYFASFLKYTDATVNMSPHAEWCFGGGPRRRMGAPASGTWRVDVPGRHGRRSGEARDPQRG